MSEKDINQVVNQTPVPGANASGGDNQTKPTPTTPLGAGSPTTDDAPLTKREAAKFFQQAVKDVQSAKDKANAEMKKVADDSIKRMEASGIPLSPEQKAAIEQTTIRELSSKADDQPDGNAQPQGGQNAANLHPVQLAIADLFQTKGMAIEDGDPEMPELMGLLKEGKYPELYVKTIAALDHKAARLGAGNGGTTTASSGVGGLPGAGAGSGSLLPKLPEAEDYLKLHYSQRKNR